MIRLRLFFNVVTYWSWVHKKLLKIRLRLFFKKPRVLVKIRIIF
jgi:hypothetical protein